MRLLRREAALADDGPRGAAVEGRAAPGGQHRAGMQAVQRTQDQPFGDRVRPIETGETAMSDGPFLKRILLACSRGPARIFRVNTGDRKSTRLNSSHVKISYAVFCLKKKKK